MRGFLFTAALTAALIPFSAAAVEKEDVRHEKLDSVVVAASRAQSTTPVTFTMVGKEEMRKTNPINSIPMMLNLQPSVIAVNEGGTGIGPSKMTIRGSKGSQINITLNGITLNDAESQEVFWVNIPSLSNILSSVQVQRGLGTTANGAGAFGASVNMGTTSISAKPYANFDIAGGSFNTFTAAAAAGTGISKYGLYLEAAYARNYTKGYIRNGKVNSQSLFATAGWITDNNSLKFTYLMGDQHSGITWNGITFEQFEKDPTYNSAGEYYDEYGNVKYYDNDTDNYTQHHFQINNTHQFDNNIVWSNTLNITKGDGYYQNYKAGKKFKKYGFRSDFDFDRNGDGVIDPSEHFGRSDKADFIVKKAMDNIYYVGNSEVRYNSDKLDVVGGVNYSFYNGKHFGRLLWNNKLGDDFNYGKHYWYNNESKKQEVSIFARAEYHPATWVTTYLDLQYRGVFLNMEGIDDEDDMSLNYKKDWHFVNPRLGASFHWNPQNKAYFSVAYGNREPGRSDLKEIIGTNNILIESGQEPTAFIKPEKMCNIELGYEYTSPIVSAAINGYFMEYIDMLLETGKLSDTGYAIKENTGRAWRRGVELSLALNPAPWIRIDANATFSDNKIKDYTFYMDTYEDFSNWVEADQRTAKHIGKTNMLMSPTAIAMVQVAVSPFKMAVNNSLKTTTFTANLKYVSRQYLDNTGNKDFSIPQYFVANFSATHEFDLKHGKLGLGLHVNNILNRKYFADGWVWHIYDKATDKEVVGDSGIFPQAPVNAMFKVSYRF